MTKSQRLAIKNAPLLPRSYCSETAPTPTPPQAAPTPAPAPTAAELVAAREERIEVQVRSNAEIFRLKMLLQFEEQDHLKERKNAEAQFARLNSRIEKLELDALAAHTRLREQFVEMANTHKAKLLDLVANADFCRNAAAPADEVKQYASDTIERIEESCQTTKQ